MGVSKISIIIPVYKVENYLRRCLDSILKQKFTAWECILIDDGSPDNSGEICDEYLKKDTRFKVIHQENAGVSVARNIGLNAAEGEWISFIDPDDWIEPDMYEIVYNRVKKDELDLIQWNYVIEKNKKHIKKHLNEKIFSYKDAEKYWLSVCWNKLIHRRLIFDNGFQFPVGVVMGEDKVFGYKIYSVSKKCLHIENYLYHYSFIETSACHSMTYNTIMQEENNIRILEKFLYEKHIIMNDNFWLIQKCAVKQHCLLNLPKPDIQLCRTIFPEINKNLISKQNITFSFVFFWINIHFDFMVYPILWLRKKMDNLIDYYHSKAI